VESLIQNFLFQKYAIRADIKQLDGYENLNYLVKVEDKPKYILKLNSDLTERPFLEVQDLVYQQLEALRKFAFPQYVYGKDGKNIYLFTDDKGGQYLAHLLEYIPGNFLTDVEKSAELIYKFGRFLAEVNLQLSNFNHPVIQARHYKWDLQHFPEYRPYLKYIRRPIQRKYVEYFLLQFNENVLPNIHELRKSTIHSDANDWNVLTAKNEITGLIDFGDVVYSPTVNELAIAAAYMALDKEDPLDSITYLIKGYHEVYPLEMKEIDILYFLIAARLCTSVCQSAKSRADNPENDYASVQEDSFWSLIEQWIAISPDHAANVFGEACGMSLIGDLTLEEIFRERQEFFSKGLSLSYNEPIHMERAAFQYMFDRTGKTYLDCVNNIMHVGHNHPQVVEAGQRQMARLNTNTRYFYNALNEYAAKLLEKFPPGHNKVFFVNSGSAASDLAIRLARTYNDRHELIVMDYGYHGNTVAGIEVSPYKFKGKGGRGKEAHIHTAPLPGLSKENSLSRADLYKCIDDYLDNPVAAFIYEPIVGCGGQIILDEEYLKYIYKKVRRAGGVCIADEVQTGFGRVGSNFWAYELQDVVPDIVVLGKPMGNGHPIAAVVTTNDIADTFENGMEFFSSFGGNPVSCKIGLSVLEVIEAENLQENALQVGNFLIEGFKSLQKNYNIVHDVRGSGLFLGIELAKRSNSISPATVEAKKIINSMKEKGILLSTDGPYNNVIKIKPPLCFNQENAAQLLEEFEKTIRSI